MKKIITILVLLIFIVGLSSLGAVSAVEDKVLTVNGTGNTVPIEKVTSSVIATGLNLAKNVAVSKQFILKKPDGAVEIHIPKKRVISPYRQVHRAPKFPLSPGVTISV